MSAVELEQMLVDSGAMLRGHFVLSSGRHSDVYVEKFRILEQPEVLSRLCTEIANHFRESDIDIVMGPTTGGIIIAFEVARQMGKPALYVESEDGVKKLRRNAELPAGARVLVVDDVLTTGKSVFEVINVVEQWGGVLAGVAVLVDRSEHDLGFKVPFFGSHRVAMTSFAPDDIPEWLAAIPTSKPGTRVNFPGTTSDL